ncbi:MAG: hypothetical protein HY517_01295 [Candidatus Aenigmarchaeota archaeon]|nr:hypothetical protein [Candidatus Aenigmarchaeota archaeon]
MDYMDRILEFVKGLGPREREVARAYADLPSSPDGRPQTDVLYRLHNDRVRPVLSELEGLMISAGCDYSDMQHGLRLALSPFRIRR